MKFGQHKMDNQGNIQHRKLRKSKWQLIEGFRLIRGLSVDDNATRLKRHLTKLVKQFQINPDNAKFRLRIKTRRAVERMRDSVGQ